MIQLELNGIGCKLVFHSYSKFTSNTWYTLIWKLEKYKPIFRTNIIFLSINILKTKNGKNRAKKGKQSNEMETKTRFFLLELIRTRKQNLQGRKKKGKK
jgi:hypothetical protein